MATLVYAAGMFRKQKVQKALSCVIAMSVLAACGSSAASSSPSGTTKPTKSPIVIGFMYQGAGNVSAAPEIGPAADSAIGYINNDLGGVNGHPLKLDKCVTDGSPTSTQQCAQQLVAAKPTLIMNAYDYNPSQLTKIAGGAGLLTYGVTEILPSDFKDPNAFYTSYGGAGGTLSLVLGILKLKPGAKKVGLFAPDSAAITPLIGLLKSLYTPLGVSLTVSQFPVSSTDLIGPWQALKSNTLDAVIGLLPASFCPAAIKAAKDSGNKTLVLTTQCASPQFAAQTNNGSDGWIIANFIDDPLGKTPDALLYQQQMAKYAPKGADLSGQAVFTFQTLYQIYNDVLKPLGFGHLSTPELRQQTAAKPSKLFLGGGLQWSCGKSPKLPSACLFDAGLSVVKGGNYTKLTGTAGTVDMQAQMEKILAP